VRDLGGFSLPEGGTTRRGAIVRSDSTGALTEAGWDALRAHGVKTIVDLRDERERDELPAHAEAAVVHVSVLDFEDHAFWASWHGLHDTPRFYREVLERWPDRFAAAVSAVARSRAGGVLVHCQVGRDRTGLVCALLLSLVGAPAEEIAADYALSAARLQPLYERLVAEAADEEAIARLHRENASEAAWMRELLAELDVEAYLLAGGASHGDFAAVRARLRGS
jgi:protein-tyrosine phosphatase